MKVTALRDRLIQGLSKIPHSAVNGDLEHRLPGNVSFCFEGIEGESLLLLLDAAGICASSMWAQASSRAAAIPAMPGTFSVPARLPRSWAPPSMTFTRGMPPRTYRAPTPLGQMCIRDRQYAEQATNVYADGGRGAAADHRQLPGLDGLSHHRRKACLLYTSWRANAALSSASGRGWASPTSSTSKTLWRTMWITHRAAPRPPRNHEEMCIRDRSCTV